MPSKQILTYGLVVLLFIPLLLINVKNSHNWGDDFAQYINQAKCIVEGRSQDDTGYIFNDQCPQLAPPAYPVGFPLMLAPIYYFFGNHIQAFSYLVSALLVVLAVLIVRLNLVYFGFMPSVIMALAFVYNPWMLRFKADVLADIPFTVFLMLSILYYLKHFRVQDNQIRNSIVLGLLIGFTVLIKTIGFVLVMGILADQIVNAIQSVRKSRKFSFRLVYFPIIAILSAAVFYAVFSNLIFPLKNEPYAYYSALFMGENMHLMESIAYYSTLIARFFSTHPVFCVLTLVLFIIGLVKKMLTRLDIIDYVCMFYLGVILLFPVYQDFRYLVPAYPFVMIYMLFGFKTLAFRFNPNKVYLVILVSMMLFLLYFHGIRDIVRKQDTIPPGPHTISAVEAFQYIQNHTESTSIFTFARPRVLALYTSRKAMIIGHHKSMEEIEAKFTEVGVDYVLTVEDLKEAIFEEYIAYYDENLELVWSNEKFDLYRRIKND